MACHQYGISAVLPHTLFHEETSDNNTNCRLFPEATCSPVVSLQSNNFIGLFESKSFDKKFLILDLFIFLLPWLKVGFNLVFNFCQELDILSDDVLVAQLIFAFYRLCITDYFASLVNCLDAELKDNKLSEGWIEREKSSASIGTYYTVHLHVLSRLLQFLWLKAKRWHGAWGGGLRWSGQYNCISESHYHPKVILSGRPILNVLHEHTLYYVFATDLRLSLQPLSRPFEKISKAS